VYAAGEQSRHWHRAVGAGLWLNLLDSGHLLKIDVIRGEEGTTVQVGSGLPLLSQ
jgi:hypothetical protein